MNTMTPVRFGWGKEQPTDPGRRALIKGAVLAALATYVGKNLPSTSASALEAPVDTFSASKPFCTQTSNNVTVVDPKTWTSKQRTEFNELLNETFAPAGLMEDAAYYGVSAPNGGIDSEYLQDAVSDIQHVGWRLRPQPGGEAYYLKLQEKMRSIGVQTRIVNDNLATDPIIGFLSRVYPSIPIEAYSDPSKQGVYFIGVPGENPPVIVALPALFGTHDDDLRHNKRIPAYIHEIAGHGLDYTVGPTVQGRWFSQREDFLALYGVTGDSTLGQFNDYVKRQWGDNPQEFFANVVALEQVRDFDSPGKPGRIYPAEWRNFVVNVVYNLAANG